MNAATMKRWATGFAFVFLSSLLMVTASERVYWYLGGATFESLFAIAGFYLIPTLAGLWALGSGPSRRLHQIILGGAIFAFVVEGVLTPIIYEDGPLPVMAALFVGWHGLLSVVGFWYFARRWLLDRSRGKLAISATLMGVYWGIWSIVYVLPEALEEFDEVYAVMEPGDFAVYALIIGATFALGHWLIGYVWPDCFEPGKWGRRGIIALCLSYAAVAVMPIVIWAPLKFAVLVGGTLWLLRKSREKTPGEPSAIASLQGRVLLRDAALLMIMPAVAGAVYAGVWSLDLSDDAVQGIFATFSVLQVLAGLVAYAWAARRSLRGTTKELVASGVE